MDFDRFRDLRGFPCLGFSSFYAFTSTFVVHISRDRTNSVISYYSGCVIREVCAKQIYDRDFSNKTPKLISGINKMFGEYGNIEGHTLKLPSYIFSCMYSPRRALSTISPENVRTESRTC